MSWRSLMFSLFPRGGLNIHRPHTHTHTYIQQYYHYDFSSKLRLSFPVMSTLGNKLGNLKFVATDVSVCDVCVRFLKNSSEDRCCL